MTKRRTDKAKTKRRTDKTMTKKMTIGLISMMH
jgi:hypothetical protein